MTVSLSRRALLGAAGVTLAIPALESLLPRKNATAGGSPPQPRRMIVYYVPNGINGSTANAFRPTAAGELTTLTPMLAPLAPVRADVMVLSGLSNRPAQASYMGAYDGPGDHARGTGSFATCARLRKTDGRDIQNGVSFDQVAADAIGMATRFPSLQLGTDGGASVGTCDSGYSCAYARNISWTDVATPLPKLTDPGTVFDRLFATGESPRDRARRNAYQSSVLDYVRRDATRLSMQLGATDRRKLDEYLTAVREVERRVAAMPAGVCMTPPRPMTGLAYQELVRVMHSMIALAFRCDLTRVVSFMLGNAGSGRDYSFIGASGAHHELSHHQSDAEKLRKLQIIGTWEIQQFSNLLQLLAGMTEPDGSRLLDHVTAVFSSEIGDGNGHTHANLPVLVAGSCDGQFNTGRHVVYSSERSIATLYLAMLRAVGARTTRFGLEGDRVLENLGPVSSA